jgi:L-ascorbate metabolism protein UlaG (beta-lactamase superfamily)
MVGHASVLVQAAGTNLLLDPVWSMRASPFAWAGPRRVAPPGVAFDALPPIDAVLLTHNHYDHLDVHTLARLHARHRPRILAPLGNEAVVRRAVPEAKVVSMDWGDGTVLAPNVRATLVPSYHWSARGTRDRRMALWGGFVLDTPAGCVYAAGDTGYGDGAIFRALRDRAPAIDLALLPIGAYEPRWFMRDQHCNPDEAVRIMQDCGAHHALGVHWGTFQLTDEAREAPVEALGEALARHGVDPRAFMPFEVGDVWTAGQA